MSSKKTTLKNWLWRCGIYATGAVTLAFGVTLNTKTGLGVSPVISMPFSIASIYDLSFPVMTFVVYSILVGIEFLLKGKQRQWQDILQIPFAIVFSSFLGLFDNVWTIQFTQLWQNLILLAFAIFLTGAGIALMVNMKLIPNPADGLAHAIALVLKKDVGLGKNVLDICSVTITCLIGLVLAHKIVGIGIGTVLAMIFVGRSVALINYLFKNRMLKVAGIE